MYPTYGTDAGRSIALVTLVFLFLSAASTASAAITILPPPGDEVSVLAAAEKDSFAGPELITLPGGERMAIWGRKSIQAQSLDRQGRPVGEVMTLVEAQSETTFTSLSPAAGPDGAILLLAYSGYPLEERWQLIRFEPTATGGFEQTATEGARVELGPIDPSMEKAVMATDPSGRPLVAWIQDDEVWARAFGADLAPAGPAVQVGVLDGSDNLLFHLATARLSDGRSLVVWEETELRFGTPDYSLNTPVEVRGRALSPTGAAVGDVFTLFDARAYADPAASISLFTTIEAYGDDSYLVAWTESPLSGGEGGLFGLELDASGLPLGNRFPVGEAPEWMAIEPAIATYGADAFAVAWTVYPAEQDNPTGVGIADFYHGIRGRFFRAPGTPAGDEFEIPSVDEISARWQPAATFDGEVLILAWMHGQPPSGYTFVPAPFGPPYAYFPEAYGLGFCTPAEHRLCLQDRRFAVEVDAPTRGGDRGPAHAESLLDDTGTFWFFRPENVELMVKVLDGRPVNGRFWFFSGALSDVDYIIHVADLWTGEETSYASGGRLVSRADSSTFDDPSERVYRLFGADETAAPVAGRTAASELEAVPIVLASPAERTVTPLWRNAAAETDGCDDPRVLCFHDGRFRARVEWTDPRSSDSGAGLAENLTDESGYFWFFRDTNAELIVKVLDGTPLTGHYWVFVGGLTDVAYRITVEDTLLGNSWSFDNPPYSLQSYADTSALPGS